MSIKLFYNAIFLLVSKKIVIAIVFIFFLKQTHHKPHSKKLFSAMAMEKFEFK